MHVTIYGGLGVGTGGESLKKPCSLVHWSFPEMTISYAPPLYTEYKKFKVTLEVGTL